MRDEHHGAGVLGEKVLEPRRSPRCRDGWSARRAAAGRAAATSARASSTRRRQPPDSVSTIASAGSSSRDSTSSTCCSMRQPSCCSSSCCSSPELRRAAPACCASATRMRRVVIAGHQLAELAEPSATTSKTERLAESGTSCSSRATRRARLKPHRAGVGRAARRSGSAAASTCRCRCGRSATPARPARSAASRRRAAADGRTRGKRD